MTKEEKDLIKGKKAQCWIGIILLVPAVLGVLSVFCGILDLGDLLDWDWLDYFGSLYNLCDIWGTHGGATSPAPIFMAISGLVGAYLIKDNLHYLCIKTKEKAEKPD